MMLKVLLLCLVIGFVNSDDCTFDANKLNDCLQKVAANGLTTCNDLNSLINCVVQGYSSKCRSDICNSIQSQNTNLGCKIQCSASTIVNLNIFLIFGACLFSLLFAKV
uniref:Transmembrane protein n=1 Tax=Panagrolaimus sp. JU765 TaxID=591449 RepID=A0AC34R0P7_9BILA